MEEKNIIKDAFDTVLKVINRTKPTTGKLFVLNKNDIQEYAKDLERENQNLKSENNYLKEHIKRMGKVR